jgi:signal transduction histidine kinase
MATEGSAPFKAKARLMLILGEQLITDEVAALFELIKNSYDADASEVDVILNDITSTEAGEILIKDDGIGMSKGTILNTWLEIGTLSKSKDEKRMSPGGRRYLGEKGIGRFAVHKLGKRTELISRQEGSPVEVEVVIDWSEFERRKDELLEDVYVHWREVEPVQFKGTGKLSHGTLLKITKLQRRWTTNMIRKLSLSVDSMNSPLAGLRNFVVTLTVPYDQKPVLGGISFTSVLETATYRIESTIDRDGYLSGSYQFSRPDLPQLSRKEELQQRIHDPDQFAFDPVTRKPRQPSCGPFRFQLYAWDLASGDKKAVFADTGNYEVVVKPNSGVRVFRDGFRVLPYGNPDDDWLSLDGRRVTGSFEEHVSRNQIIGVVEISGQDNSMLRDKSDREGLIDNEPFADFKSLLLGAIRIFESQRVRDRTLLKKFLKRTREARIDRVRQTLTKVEELIEKSPEAKDKVVLNEVRTLLDNAKKDIFETIEETEEPLLVAAAIGLTYMIPTHEVRRYLHDMQRTLARLANQKVSSQFDADLQLVRRFARRADEVVAGVAKVFQRGRMTTISLRSVAEEAAKIMQDRMSANQIRLESHVSDVKIRGSERLLMVVLLNLIDNSSYWLKEVDPANRQINVVVSSMEDGSPVLIVSDNGPGLADEISVLSQPFITYKSDGMGLGLYIADRIALSHGGRLRSFEKEEVEHLLDGASVGIAFPRLTVA